MNKQRFWLIVSVVTGLLWAVMGAVMDGVVAAVILGIIGFVGTLFMAGMVCAGSDRRGGSDDETLEM